MTSLPIVTVRDQQPLQAAKWLKIQILLDFCEMERLLEELNHPFIFLTGVLLNLGEEEISTNNFLEKYREYVTLLKRGIPAVDDSFRQLFSSVLTTDRDTVYGLDVGEKIIVRAKLPIIQLQLHRLGFSHVDKQFRSMVFGKDALSWGIQFSYPQIFQDPETKEIVNVKENFVNTSLFKQMQRWVRSHTLPTPFIVDHTQINVPIRLGKRCFAWINNHPQLALHGLRIKC